MVNRCSQHGPHRTLRCVALLFGGLAAAPVAADKPVEGFEFGEPFLDFNPCTGELVEFTIDVVFLDHVHQNNFVSPGKRTGFTSDGYTMVHGNDMFTENNNGFMFSFNDVWRNDEGSKFRVAGTFVFNANKGELLVDRSSLRCLGAKTILP